MTEPKSLQEAIVYFSNPDNCIDYLAIRRWEMARLSVPLVAPRPLNSALIAALGLAPLITRSANSLSRSGLSWKIPLFRLDKWLTATWLVTNCKNGISSYEIARDVKVTQKSAWFMLHRIRLAMQDDFFGSKLGGEVEVDETFIGGKARNMHVSERKRRITGNWNQGQDRRYGNLGAWRKGSRQLSCPTASKYCIARAGTQACQRWIGALLRCAHVLRSDLKLTMRIKSLTMRFNT